MEPLNNESKKVDRPEFLSNQLLRTKSLEIKRSHKSHRSPGNDSYTGKPIKMNLPEDMSHRSHRSPSVASHSSMVRPTGFRKSETEDNMSTASEPASSIADSGVESVTTDWSRDTPFTVPPDARQNPRHAAPGDVACDLCEEIKLKACKSCMTCLASFCELHVQGHYTIEPLNRHLLVEVTKNLGNLQESAQMKKILTKEREENQRLKDENLSLKKENESLRQRICKLRLPDYICQGKVPVAADLTLDPETAHCALLLSDDCKQVRVGDKTTVHQTSQRFDKWECVLAKEGFSSGRHYWEVEVNREFTIGVSRQSAQRKGKFIFCPSEGYWCLYHFRQAFSALDDSIHRLQVNSFPRVLGVCIDVDEKWVAFYNSETKAQIYTFRNMTFTDGEKIYPLFNTLEKSANLEIKTEMFLPLKLSLNTC
ncbi:pyrin-like [Astyanax mexicanus]|uniref:Butyrophilin subfamily 1 member A1 n=1 Tax=Astyanax mexicanus TaxID=7994 RepID=A0A8B9J7L6_ASTMX|nr:pyrin-like [Astyanax mexicanus]